MLCDDFQGAKTPSAAAAADGNIAMLFVNMKQKCIDGYQ